MIDLTGKVAVVTGGASGIVRGELAGQTPRRRWGTPEDVANAVLFLASALSDHVCGENLVVDGGWLIGTPLMGGGSEGVDARVDA